MAETEHLVEGPDQFLNSVLLLQRKHRHTDQGSDRREGRTCGNLICWDTSLLRREGCRTTLAHPVGLRLWHAGIRSTKDVATRAIFCRVALRAGKQA